MKTTFVFLVSIILLTPAIVCADYLGDVTSDRDYQAWLGHGDHINIFFSYKIEDPEGGRVSLQPYTNGSPTPGYGWAGSPLYPQGIGVDTNWLTVNSGTALVDQIRISLWNSSFDEQLLELFIPVEYHFSAKGITNIVLSHSQPSWLEIGEHLEILHDFTSDEPGLLFARPYYQGEAVSAASSSWEVITPPADTGSHFFYLYGEGGSVDAIRFWLESSDQSELLWEAYIPVNYHWGETGLSNISFNFEDQQYLPYNEHIIGSFDYATSDPDGIRIWMLGAKDGEIHWEDMQYQGSSLLYDTGSATRYFLYTGDQDINQILFWVTSEDQSETYIEALLPFDVSFRENVVNNVTFTPGAPAILEIPEAIWTSFSYSSAGADSFLILNYGYANGEWAETGTGVGDYAFPPTGTGENWFTYDEPNPILIDQVRFNMQTNTARESIGNCWYPTLHFFGTSAVATHAPEESPALSTRLVQNFPNPFNPKTTLSFNVSEAGDVQLGIFDVQGRLVRLLMDQHVAAGPHAIEWDGNNAQGEKMSSGVYFSKLMTKDDVQTRKMVLIK